MCDSWAVARLNDLFGGSRRWYGDKDVALLEIILGLLCYIVGIGSSGPSAFKAQFEPRLVGINCAS